jgi:hypothetical protein
VHAESDCREVEFATISSDVRQYKSMKRLQRTFSSRNGRLSVSIYNSRITVGQPCVVELYCR